MRKTFLLGAIVLFAATMLPYAINLDSFWLMDDVKQIQRGMTPGLGQAFSDSWGARENFFRPLVVLLSMMDGALWGKAAWGYRLTNYIMFFLSGILVWLTASRFMDRRLAWFAALIFLLHPIQVGTVVWLSGRVDILPGVLLFGSAALMVRVEKRAMRAAGCCLFAAALFAKETSIMFPVALFVADLADGSSRKKAAGRALVPALTAFAYIILRLAFGSVPGARYYNPMNMLHFPIIILKSAVSFLLNVIYIFFPFVHPMDILSVDYHQPGGLFETLFNMKTVLPGLYMLAGICVLSIWIYRWLKRTEERREIWFAAVWFFAFLAPIVHVLANLAGYRYFFISLLSGAMIVVWAGDGNLGKLPAIARKTIIAGFILLLLAMNVREQLKWKEAFDTARSLTVATIDYTQKMPQGSVLVVEGLPKYTEEGRLVYPEWDSYSLPMSVSLMGGRSDVKVRVSKEHLPGCGKGRLVCVTAGELLEGAKK